jgi:hypothetical protein
MTFQQYPFKGGIPSGNTAGRPSNPVIGDTYYNGQLEILEIFNGTIWVAASAPPATPQLVSVTDVGAVDYTSGGSLDVLFSAGSGGGTPNQYNAFTTAGGFGAYSPTTTVTISGLTISSSFIVYGNAQNNFGTTVNTPNAAAVTVTTKPQTPTIGTATVSAGDVIVTWTLNNNGGKSLTAITITPFLNGTTPETSRTAATTSSTSYTFTSGQLTGGASYTFKVTATNANGTSPFSSASNSITVANAFTVDFLVLAGGAGGAGGGGGAGGYRTSVGTSGRGSAAESALSLVSGVNYSVTVGGGGALGSNISLYGGTGGNSTFATITSSGGGGGGGGSAGNFYVGANGGCGGGGAAYLVGNTANGGSGTANQGFDGGAAQGSGGDYGSGGGGGVGGVGQTVSGSTGGGTAGGNGGVGITSSISGSSVTYGTGGKGYSAGGGGDSPVNIGKGGDGKTEAGGGNGRAGGSGVVILKYPDSRTITIGAGLTGSTAAPSGGFKVSTITLGTGNVSWS